MPVASEGLNVLGVTGFLGLKGRVMVRIMLYTDSYFKVRIIAQCSVKDGRRSESMKYVHIVT